MKKTTTVNLNGMVFHIDEDAFLELSNYLSIIELKFKNEDEKEIIKDIEARIAELFTEKLSSQNKSVVEISDVEQVMEIMGNPKDMDEDGKEQSAASETSSNKKTFKKFYRDGSDAMLGGVCSGIAAYSNVNVTAIRVLAIILIFAGFGIVIPVYLILCLVTPQAVTAAEKLEMRGSAVNLDTLKEEWDSARSYVSSEEFQKNAKSIGQKIFDAILLMFKVVALFVAAWFIFIGGIVVLALLFALFVFLVTGTFLFDSADMFGIAAYSSNDMLFLLLSILVFVLALIIGLCRMVKSAFQKKYKQNHTVSGILLVVSVVSFFAIIFFGLKFSSSFMIDNVGNVGFYNNNSSMGITIDSTQVVTIDSTQVVIKY